MRGILSFIVVLGALFDTGHCASCPDGYTMNPDSGLCYKVMTVKRNWNEANVHCQTEGAELASIKSSDEWQFVKGLLNSTGINQRVWINGKDETNEGTWLWTDGSLVSTFSDWYPRRPAKDTTRNCITLMEDREWRWHDVDCSSIRYSVCKRSADCTNGFVDVNSGTCYNYKPLKDKQRNWKDSRAICLEAGGDLANVRSVKEWQFVKDVLTKHEVGYKVWLGARDQEEEGTWLWTDGSPVVFTESDWYTGYPTKRTSHNCLVTWHGNWKWYEAPCEYTHYAVCKIPGVPLNTSPTPTCPPAPTCPPVTSSLSTTTCPPAPTCPSVSSCPSTTTCPSCPTCPPVTTSPSTTTCPPAPTCPTVTTCPTTKPVTCTNGFVDSNTGHCYKYKVLNDKKRTWNEAKSVCEAWGAELASIRSSQEWQFVKVNILSVFDTYIWLGGTDVQQESSWLWTDGSPVSFTDWIDYTIIQWMNTKWNCLVARGYSYGNKWFDLDCFVEIYALCKIQA